MNISYPAYCTLVVISALAVSAFIAPLLWDAAGHIESILVNIYNPEGGG